MKKLNNIKWFSLGVAVCLLVSFMIVPAVASSMQKQATLHYNDIKITLNGNAITPKDASGNVVEPFIIDGTTYLPVRAVANALGIGVDWDASNNTVLLTNKQSVPSGTVLFEKNGIKITYLGIADSTYGGEEIKLFIENTSTKNYGVQTRNESVNGIMTNPIFSCTVAAGKSAYDSIEFSKSSLDANNITSIAEVEFYFTVFNDDNWSDKFESGIIKVSK